MDRPIDRRIVTACLMYIRTRLRFHPFFASAPEVCPCRLHRPFHSVRRPKAERDLPFDCPPDRLPDVRPQNGCDALPPVLPRGRGPPASPKVPEDDDAGPRR